jgi:NAD(P)-dependent dehydrogenase (short-subunit alcohol dehydrogenase family)
VDSVHELDHNIVRSHGGSTNQPVLLTGAASALGWQLAAALAAQGWTLRLTDIVAYPGTLSPGTTFTQADLADRPAIAKLAVGCGAILPFRRHRPLHEAVAVATVAGGPETASCCVTPQVWGSKASHTRWPNRI